MNQPGLYTKFVINGVHKHVYVYARLITLEKVQWDTRLKEAEQAVDNLEKKDISSTIVRMKGQLLDGHLLRNSRTHQSRMLQAH